ncbi:MAG: bifunctional (p)ppGpp synthetase/guanosine-3',5'-bis(diphosphate) 3'-pyrophosphohydrolase [Acidobacteriaceae bacterium]
MATARTTPPDPIASRPAPPDSSEAREGRALIDARFRALLDTVRAHRPGDDVEIIRRAWEFSLEHHQGQVRASGEPYVLHPLEVAHVLAEMKLDSTAIAAGLLHDAVEDTPVTADDITRLFGEQVAHIVEGVTKIDKIQFANSEDRQAENVRKMLLAMVTDVRVVLIKLADRLHNMRTLQHLRVERQQAIAQETLDIYAPLAHRLGMGKVRGELEDLSFRYVDAVSFDKVQTAIDERRKEGEDFLEDVERTLQEKLKEHKIEARVEWRIKRLYSIYQKLQKQRSSVDQVYDLLAVRVITKSVQDCYAIFGLIHSIWRPVPGRIKDFIAMPRPNLYQSLHTTVMGSGGHQFEVQIRTEEMHRVAEEGIAAHWKYKANGGPISSKDEQRLAWVRSLVEWQREMSDPNEFLSTLKIDLYPEEVYTFTPKGKVVVLPKDASPVDFAYSVHTEVGQTCTGARVNGRMVPLRTRLRNGDIVEIVTQNGHTPSRDWLTFVKSSRARNKIKHWLNEHQRERAIDIGGKLLDREARKYKVALARFTEADYTRVANEYGVGGEKDLLAGIGFGKYSSRQVLHKLEPSLIAPSAPDVDAAATADTVKKLHLNPRTEALEVEGQNDLLVYRARCCNPIRGEEIIGYVTRGRGVAVHARRCSNVQNLLYEADRRISVEWSKNTADERGRQQTYPVRVVVYCDDRAGMLKNLTAIISDDGTNIRSVDSRAGKDGEAIVEFILEAEDVAHLDRIVTGLRTLPGVRDVERASKV